MVVNPEVQAKAQAEIDSILGYASRLPTMVDEVHMPYVRVLIQEVLRWHPVTPTGMMAGLCAQGSFKRLTYERIGGTPHAELISLSNWHHSSPSFITRVANTWAMSRDENVYKDPEAFDPERFLNQETPHVPAFGWGRRKCPGMHFAEISLFVTIASLLATFRFSRKKDRHGNEIIPRIEGAVNSLTVLGYSLRGPQKPRSAPGCLGFRDLLVCIQPDRECSTGTPEHPTSTSEGNAVFLIRRLQRVEDSHVALDREQRRHSIPPPCNAARSVKKWPLPPGAFDPGGHSLGWLADTPRRPLEVVGSPTRTSKPEHRSSQPNQRIPLMIRREKTTGSFVRPAENHTHIIRHACKDTHTRLPSETSVGGGSSTKCADESWGTETRAELAGGWPILTLAEQAEKTMRDKYPVGIMGCERGCSNAIHWALHEPTPKSGLVRLRKLRSSAPNGFEFFAIIVGEGKAMTCDEAVYQGSGVMFPQFTIIDRIQVFGVLNCNVNVDVNTHVQIEGYPELVDRGVLFPGIGVDYTRLPDFPNKGMFVIIRAVYANVDHVLPQITAFLCTKSYLPIELSGYQVTRLVGPAPLLYKFYDIDNSNLSESFYRHIQEHHPEPVSRNLRLPECLVALVRHYWLRVFGRKLRHPPAPRSLPFIGNILSIPSGLDYLGYFELGKRLGTESTNVGDIIYMDMMGKPAIVLNTAQAASDLFEKRSAIYSDRRSASMVKSASLCVQGHLALSIATSRRLILLPVRLDWPGFIPSLSYSDQWRRQRRRMNNWLNMRAVRQFDGIQQEAVRRLLGCLLEIPESPAPFKLHPLFLLSAMAYATFKLAYGYRLKGDQDPFFLDAIEATDNVFCAMMKSNFFVNAFPILEYVPGWLPGAGWKKTARKWREQKNHAVAAPYEWTKRQVASGDFEPSVLSALLQDDPAGLGISTEEREQELKELAYILFAGEYYITSGPKLYQARYDLSSTLCISSRNGYATALVNFVAAMVIKPEVQAKAQAEVDSVLGNVVRLPTIADRSQMPYVGNLIQEVMRWHPVAPTGGDPHVCFQDDVYQGYDIQKGTMIPRRFQSRQVLGSKRPGCAGIWMGKTVGNMVSPSPLCTHNLDVNKYMPGAAFPTYNFSRKKDKNGKEIIPIVEGAVNSLTVPSTLRSAQGPKNIEPLSLRTSPKNREIFLVTMPLEKLRGAAGENQELAPELRRESRDPLFFDTIYYTDPSTWSDTVAESERSYVHSRERQQGQRKIRRQKKGGTRRAGEITRQKGGLTESGLWEHDRLRYRMRAGGVGKVQAQRA
ncbi:cytochrome P450 domain-containing protein [Rhizoctonia solani AG-1 IA]|uniref:Cytochrome P450 domain-containing protein n=1 Tax=Thanatephorus cucumeris (strain AG1-IA) TaxID=983506 RepID=L8WE40_THACA|nr:cytochrome P450 domain-containing protein [Rhizoctonia solani AG-1 IA]